MAGDVMPEIQIDSPSRERRQTRTYDQKGNNLPGVVEAVIASLVPTGALVPTMAEEADGNAFLLCRGQDVAVADYPRLFALIGYRHGGAGPVFRLPNLTGRGVIGAGGDAGLALGAIAGAASVTLSIDQMPRHSHSFTAEPHGHEVTDPGHSHTAAVAGSGITAGAAGGAATESATSTEQTGITVSETTISGTVGEAGGAEPVSILNPVFAVNWLVKT